MKGLINVTLSHGKGMRQAGLIQHFMKVVTPHFLASQWEDPTFISSSQNKQINHHEITSGAWKDTSLIQRDNKCNSI